MWTLPSGMEVEKTVHQYMCSLYYTLLCFLPPLGNASPGIVIYADAIRYYATSLEYTPGCSYILDLKSTAFSALFADSDWQHVVASHPTAPTPTPLPSAREYLNRVHDITSLDALADLIRDMMPHIFRGDHKVDWIFMFLSHW